MSNEPLRIYSAIETRTELFSNMKITVILTKEDKWVQYDPIPDILGEKNAFRLYSRRKQIRILDKNGVEKIVEGVRHSDFLAEAQFGRRFPKLLEIVQGMVDQLKESKVIDIRPNRDNYIVKNAEAILEQAHAIANLQVNLDNHKEDTLIKIESINKKIESIDQKVNNLSEMHTLRDYVDNILKITLTPGEEINNGKALVKLCVKENLIHKKVDTVSANGHRIEIYTYPLCALNAWSNWFLGKFPDRRPF